MQIGKVIIDIASSLVDKIFDYLLPENEIQVGSRVLVPFGKTIKEGYLVEICQNSDYDPTKLKKIISKIDKVPVINSDQLELAKFMKRKFHTGMCDALRLFLPSELRNGKVKELIKINCFIDDELKAKEYLSKQRKNATSIIGAINYILENARAPQPILTKKSIRHQSKN